MHPEDSIQFEQFLMSLKNVSIQNGEHYNMVYLHDAWFQYEKSVLKNGLLTAGRISIATNDLDGNPNFEECAEIEALYKKCRLWLRKQYNNNMLACSVADPSIKQPTKNFWLGPTAQKWLLNEQGKLRQFESAGPFFEKST